MSHSAALDLVTYFWWWTPTEANHVIGHMAIYYGQGWIIDATPRHGSVSLEPLSSVPLRFAYAKYLAVGVTPPLRPPPPPLPPGGPIHRF